MLTLTLIQDYLEEVNLLLLVNFINYELNIVKYFHLFCIETVVRDITERGRDLEQILTQYMTFVKPAFEEFCSPVSVEMMSLM